MQGNYLIQEYAGIHQSSYVACLGQMVADGEICHATAMGDPRTHTARRGRTVSTGPPMPMYVPIVSLRFYNPLLFSETCRSLGATAAVKLGLLPLPFAYSLQYTSSHRLGQQLRFL